MKTINLYISLLMLFGLLISNESRATKVTAVLTGNWNSDLTWDDTHPGCYDSIIIPAGIVVTVTVTEDLFSACADSIVLEVRGTLAFNNGRRLELPCDSDMYIYPGGSIVPGGGGGSSTYIEICNTQYWSASDGVLTGPSTLCDGCSELPIELVSFEGKIDDAGGGITLNWETGSEKNNDYFSILRSGNGVNWDVIHTLPGAGNSSNSLRYSYTDIRPFLGYNYYKLKQTDYDGKTSTSDPILVLNGAETLQEKIVVFPITNAGIINVFLRDKEAEHVTINLYTFTGKLTYQTEKLVSPDGIVTLSLEGNVPASSIYLLEVEGITETVKLAWF